MEAVKQEIVRDVKIAYWEAAKAQLLVELSRENALAVEALLTAAKRQVDVGDNVARGQTLAVISSVELAAARAEYRQAAARLKAAEQSYNNQARLAKLGAFSNRPVEEASVYEKDLDKIKTGQTTEIRINGRPGKVYTGRVTHIGDVLDSESRTAKVRCAVSNADGTLKPEMFASVNIITGSRSGAVLIPKQAVLDDADKKIVFVACTDCPEDNASGSGCGEYDRLEVEVGPVHGGRVEILHGLNPGQEVVVEGQYQLKTSLGSGDLHAGCADGH